MESLFCNLHFSLVCYFKSVTIIDCFCVSSPVDISDSFV
jgi:hypothetical protein